MPELFPHTTASIFSQLLPEEAVVVETRQLSILPLKPAEAAYIRNAVPQRQAEFATGRACARKAMSRFGHADTEIPVLGRAPVFPEQLCGSITHTKDYCAAAVAFRDQLVGLGIDAEPRRSLAWTIVEMILLPEEIAYVRRMGGESHLPILFFSMKESFYKAYYTLRPIFLDFKDVRISIENEAEFHIKILNPAHKIEHKLTGRYSIDHEFVRTAVAIAALTKKSST